MTDDGVPESYVALLERILADVERELCGKKVPQGSQWHNLKAIARSLRQSAETNRANKEAARRALFEANRLHARILEERRQGCTMQTMDNLSREVVRLRHLAEEILRASGLDPAAKAEFRGRIGEVFMLPEDDDGRPVSFPIAATVSGGVMSVPGFGIVGGR